MARREDDDFNFGIWDSTKCHAPIVSWYSGGRCSPLQRLMCNRSDDFRREWHLQHGNGLYANVRWLGFQINVRLYRGAFNENGRPVVYLQQILQFLHESNHVSVNEVKKWLFEDAKNIFYLFHINHLYKHVLLERHNSSLHEQFLIHKTIKSYQSFK